jgi:hypothetical protein
LPAVFRFAVLLLLVGAAPAGAALSDERALACTQLSNDAAIFVGEAGEPFAFRPYADDIDAARAAWLAAKAESDRSPSNIELLMKTLDAHAELEHRETIYPDLGELLVTPITVERTFRGTQTATNFVVLPKGAKVEPGRLYLVYAENDRFPFYQNLYTVDLSPKEVSRAHRELQVLDEASSSELGMVTGVLDEEDPSDANRLTPLFGITLRLTGEGYAENVVTDADGAFIATNVPPGIVTVAPLLAGRFRVSTVRVIAGGCAAIPIVVSKATQHESVEFAR